jgi:hypothetical protein
VWHRRLRRAGVRVQVGAAVARREQHRGFLSVVERDALRRAEVAATPTATPLARGESRWITGRGAREAAPPARRDGRDPRGAPPRAPTI